MTPEEDVLRSLVRAREATGRALQRLVQRDLAGTRECEEGLGHAILDLQRATDHLQNLSALPDDELRTTIEDMKKQARRIERVVDASAAFLRAGLSGDTAIELYGANGQLANQVFTARLNGTEA